jgi:hypothetical protein
VGSIRLIADSHNNYGHTGLQRQACMKNRQARGMTEVPYRGSAPAINFFFNDTATTEIYTLTSSLSLHDALPISIACSD